ncbi:MAG TPA: hypothetical protein VMO47_08510, partial [Rhodothermales bacterium]|nr:hypothetical protein [Rhodothermales bacterium]
MTQDHRGIMYFGNGTGVHEFDGVTWRNIPTANSATVRSLDVAADGTVFVGGVRELGYLAPDEHGRARYVSILNDLPEDQREFTDVWHTFARTDGVYFFTDDRLIHWHDGEVRVKRSTTSFHVAFDLGDAIYVREWEQGMKRIVGDELILLPGGDRFKDERVYNMLPFGDGRILVTTRTQGQFLFDGTGFTPWKTDVDAYLAEKLVYLGGSVLPSGDFALPTIAGGLVILDKEGKQSEIIDRAKGIRDNSVLLSHVDRRGDLWLGLNAGIARIEISSPFTIFDDRSGITSTVGNVLRYKGDLYGASQVGVYKFSSTKQLWEILPGLTNQTFGIDEFKGRLMVAAGNSGVFQLAKGRLVLVKGTIDNTYATASIEPSKFDTNRVFVTLLGGISALRMDQDGVWVDEGLVPGVENTVFGILEESPTSLWAGTFDGGLLHVTLPDDGLPRPLERAKALEFGADAGLSDNGTAVFELEGTIYAASKNGYVRVEGIGKFEPDSTFDAVTW